MRVRDAMRPGVVTCRPGATLGEIARILSRDVVHAAFVVSDDGREILGVVTDTDLLAGEWLGDPHDPVDVMTALTARDLMSRPVETIDVDEPVTQAASTLLGSGVARLLVTDAGAPVGVIAVSTLVAVASATDARPRRVRDVMSHALVICRPQTPMYAAARAMTERRSRSLVIVDDDGRPLGVLTGRDVLRAINCASAPVGNLVQAPVDHVDPDASLQAAVDLMVRRETNRLLVMPAAGLAGSLPLGMLSSFDIVAEMAQSGSRWSGG